MKVRGSRAHQFKLVSSTLGYWILLDTNYTQRCERFRRNDFRQHLYPLIFMLTNLLSCFEMDYENVNTILRHIWNDAESRVRYIKEENGIDYRNIVLTNFVMQIKMDCEIRQHGIAHISASMLVIAHKNEWVYCCNYDYWNYRSSSEANVFNFISKTLPSFHITNLNWRLLSAVKCQSPW